MSKEHLWSDWMRKGNLLPLGGEHEEFSKVMDGHSGKTKSVFRRVRQGTANTKKIRVVCRNCNVGWMSQLEAAAQPYLTALIKSAPIVLSSEARQILTEWIVMKVLVAEHNSYRGHPADPIFDQVARTTFMKSRIIPGAFGIWFSLQNSTKWVTGFYRFATGLGFTKTWPPPPSPPNPLKTIQSVTWGMGGLLIYVQAFTDPDLYNRLQPDPRGPFTRLWPPEDDDIAWPPKSYLKADSIDRLASALDEFVMSDAVTRSPPSA